MLYIVPDVEVLQLVGDDERFPCLFHGIADTVHVCRDGTCKPFCQDLIRHDARNLLEQLRTVQFSHDLSGLCQFLLGRLVFLDGLYGIGYLVETASRSMGLVFLLWFFLRISKFIRCQATERFIQFSVGTDEGESGEPNFVRAIPNDEEEALKATWAD